MADISTLWVCDGLGICRREWIASDVGVIVHAADWIDEYTLFLGEGKNDGVILTPKNSDFLATDDARCLVSILRKNHLHMFVWKDGVGIDYGSTGDVTDGASQE